MRNSHGYCESPLAGLRDQDLGTIVKWGAAEAPKAVPAMLLVSHGALHYGNLVTYMRLRGMVPPETGRAGQQAKPAKIEMVTYYMGFLKKGPKWSPEITDATLKIQEGHMNYLRKSGESGKLILAGPFGGGGEIRGILVYRTSTIDEARKIAEADPAVLAGRLVLEIHPWMVQKGHLP